MPRTSRKPATSRTKDRCVSTYELTRAEKTRALAAAKAAGQTLSVWAGRALRDALKVRTGPSDA